MTTAFAAWLVGSINILRFTSVQANQGIGLEFQYIIAAVIGGCLLTGGFGSAIGAAIGALIFGMARQGIVFANWNSDWFQLFLGVMLLAAVLVNNIVRRRAERVAAMTTTRPDRGPTTSARPTAASSRCSDVSTVVNAGEVTCVLGDNGAGKSTLIKILAGVHQHDEGEFLGRGRARSEFSSPREALRPRHRDRVPGPRGVPLMSVWRNFFLGSEPTMGSGPLRPDRRARPSGSRAKALAEMGIDLRDVEQPVGTLSGGERQCVAIARAVHFGAKVLILDEPTVALGVKQAGVVLQYVAQARDRGLGRRADHAQPAPRLPGRRPVPAAQARPSARARTTKAEIDPRS